MSIQPQEPKNQWGLPGSRVQKLASRNAVCRTILSHAHVLQIIEDHQAMWLSAGDAEERERIERRLRKQLALAGVNFVAFETAMHGAAVSMLGDPLIGGSLILVGAVVMRWVGLKGG